MPLLLIHRYWDTVKFGLIVFLSSLCMLLIVCFRATISRILLGKRWVFPPGHVGPPFVGNLYQMRRVRHDTARMAHYVGCLCLLQLLR